MLLTNLLFFVLACSILILSGTYLVKSLSKIARFLRITEFSAAFIIMAVITSFPELFVGINAGIQKQGGIVLGNIIGANILDITIVIAIPVLIARGIKIKSKDIRKDFVYAIFIAILPLLLFLIGKEISRIDAIILLFVFFVYSYKIIKRRREYTKQLEDGVKRLNILLNTILFVLLIFVLFFSASYTVNYAILLSEDLNLPKIMIGLFLVSIGTTLPELIFGISSVKEKHKEMMLGDSIGSIVCNSTLIIGISALIYPIKSAFSPFLIAALFLFLVLILFAFFLNSKNEISIREAIILIFIYILFIIFEFYLK